MKTLLKQLLALAVVVGGFFAFTAWPRIGEVETGKTPEYPDLTPHDYGASLDSVAKSVKKVIGERPRWELTGEAKGPVGIDLQGVHTMPFGLLTEDVTVRLRREKGRTVVGVRSKSRHSLGDFGQNARNVRELLSALDREVF